MEVEQHDFFGQDHKSALTIQVAAGSLLVSEASIRNWIKTGYLEQAGKNTITLESFNQFKCHVIGKEKLTKMANKSEKFGHDHLKLVQTFSRLVGDMTETGDSISQQYEASLSESYKNKEGIFYTPLEVARKLFEQLPGDCSNLTFCDPCCGTGNFLIAALERGFRPSNIYGFDIDETAIEIARRRLMDLDIGEEISLKSGDFLQEAISGKIEAFDVVFTNPPWGKKIPKNERDYLARALGSGESKDTSAIFFSACLMILKQSGYLGMLFQEAFFNVATFESARVKALDLQVKALIDFGKPFEGLVTKARAIVIRNLPADDSMTIIHSEKRPSTLLAQNSFRTNPKSIISFNQSPSDANVIQHLLSIEHRTLKGNASYGLGIVTGNNTKYCLPEMCNDHIAVYRGADITRTGLKPASAFIPKDLSVYQQVAPLELYKANEKLIYKFISSELVFFHDTEQRFMLNSANMLVVNKDFPINHQQICFLLNTRLMSWLFLKMFETHKVLRSDIEALPIYVNYFRGREDYSESSLLDFLSLKEVSHGAFGIKN